MSRVKELLISLLGKAPYTPQETWPSLGSPWSKGMLLPPHLRQRIQH